MRNLVLVLGFLERNGHWPACNKDFGKCACAASVVISEQDKGRELMRRVSSGGGRLICPQ
jgi:hypothetical protein